jgi:hypothetical protein
MDIEIPEQEIPQQLSAQEQWGDMMTASIRSSRAYLNMVLQREAAEPLDRRMKITSAIRHGRRITAHVLEEQNFAKTRLKSRTAGISSQGKLQKDDGSPVKTDKLSSQAFSYAETSVMDIRDHGNGTSDVSLQLDEKAKLKLGDPAYSEMYLEPISAYDTRALTTESRILERFIKNEGLTAPGRIMKSGEFPKPPFEGLETREDLDEAQNKAYGLAMSFDKCPVLFIHGGPGTGKTSTICNIVKGHIENGRKVLVLSHSNKGAQVPAKRLKDSGVKVHIAGNDPEKVMEELRSSRIKWKANYPAERIEEIKRMSDEKILALLPPEISMKLIVPTYMQVGKGDKKKLIPVNSVQLEKNQGEVIRAVKARQGEVIKAIKAKRKQMIDELIGKHQIKLLENDRKFKKSMEGGGVAFSTLGTLLNDEILATTGFDVVIVDEATRMSMPDVVLALQKAGKQIIFVGDPLQLGNIPLSPDDEKDLQYMLSPESMARSLPGHYNEPVKRAREELISSTYTDPKDVDKAVDIFEKGPFGAAILGSENPEQDLPYVFLDRDRRSLPAIVNVLSPLIYKGKLKPGREADEKLGDGVVQWVDTSKLSPHEKTSGTSRKNSVEIQLIVDKVLEALFRQKVTPEDIAVIAAYGSQAEAIREKLGKYTAFRKDSELYARLCANISTVDAFQGDERKKVFVSLTRSNKEGKIGFLDEERRIGVAIGRAQEELYIVGDMSTVVEKNDNPQSQAFFTQMRDLIAQNGSVVSSEPEKRRRRRRGGHGRTSKEKRLHEAAVEAKLAKVGNDKRQVSQPVHSSDTRDVRHISEDDIW